MRAMSRALTLFILPLALVHVVRHIGGQFINGGLARLPDATASLAAFGLAYGLIFLLASPLSQLKQTALVLIEGQSSHRALRRATWTISALAVLTLALGLFTPLGGLVIETAHGIAPPFSLLVRKALTRLIPFPLIFGLIQIETALLVRARRTDIVGAATAAAIAASILSVFFFLEADFVRADPLWLPIIALYARVVVELAILALAARRLVVPTLASGDRAPSARAILAFFWPLAFILSVQGASRPVINLFVARGPDAEGALAALTVVYALGLLPYSWLNELKNVWPPFHAEDGARPILRRFAIACGLISFALMAAMFVTPLRPWILQDLIGVDAELAERCRVPLMVFSLVPIIVAIRSHLHGQAMVARRTRAIAPSAPTRLATHLIAMPLLGFTALAGATQALIALVVGFVSETIVVWWGLRVAERADQKP